MGGALDFVKDIGKSIINGVKSVVKSVTTAIKKVVNTVVDAVKKIVDTVVKVVKDVVEFVSDFVVNLAKGIINFIRTGNIVEIILTVVAAIMTGGYSLIVQFGVPALTTTMVQHGIISESWAMAINIGVQIYSMWMAYSSMSSNISNMSNFFQGLGVSIETATWLATSINTAMSIIGPLMALKNIYDAYKDAKAIKDAYETMLAEFEAWKATLGDGRFSYISKLESADREITSHADNSYYRKLPGQPGYAPFSAGHSNYVATDAAAPAHWVEDNKAPYNEDPKIAKMMWSNKFANPMAEFDVVPYNFENGTTYNTYVSAGYDLSSGSSGGINVIGVATRNAKLEVQRVEYQKIIADNKEKSLQYMDGYYKAQAAEYTLNNYIAYLDEQMKGLKNTFKTEVIDKLIVNSFIEKKTVDSVYVPVQNITTSSVMSGTAVNKGADYQYDELLKWYYGADNSDMFGEQEIANAYFSHSKATGLYKSNGEKNSTLQPGVTYRLFNKINDDAWTAIIDSSKTFNSSYNELKSNKEELIKQRTINEENIKKYYSNEGSSDMPGLKDVLQYVTGAELVNLFEVGGYGNIKGFSNDVGLGFTDIKSRYSDKSSTAVEDSYWSGIKNDKGGDLNYYTAGNKSNVMKFSSSASDYSLSGLKTMDYDEMKSLSNKGLAGTISVGVDWSKFSGSASEFNSQIMQLASSNPLAGIYSK